MSTNSSTEDVYIPYPVRNHTVYENTLAPNYIWKMFRIGALLARENCSVHGSQTFVWDTHLHVATRANFWQVEALANLRQVKARANLRLSSGMVSMSLDIYPRPYVGPNRDIVSIPTVYYVLVDRILGRHVVRSCHTPFGTTFDYSLTFNCDLFPKSWLTTPFYNVNDSVEIEVYVARPEQLYSYDGVLRWTVEEFQETKEATTVSEGDESRYFCTHIKGYVAQAQLTYYLGRTLPPGGLERGSLMVRIAFWSGEFDNNRRRTFPHLTNITLMNPEYPFSLIENTIRGNSVCEFDDWYVRLNDDRIIDAESLEIRVEIKPHVSLMAASQMDFQLGNVRPRGPNSKKFCFYTFRV